jgi:hypothetical protein
MPTLIACSPVKLHNVNKGSYKDVELVSFEKKSHMVVKLYDTDVTMAYNHSKMTYEATGPKNDFWSTTGPSFRVE